MKTHISYKQILLLALPIYGGLVAGQLITLADTYFLGKVNSLEQSAAGIGGLLYTVFFLMGYGFTTGGQILIARRIGQGREREVGRIFWNMIWLSLLYAAAVILFFIFLSPSLFSRILSSGEISYQASRYLQYRSFGFLGTQLSWCFAAYNIGRGKSGAVTVASIVNALVNIVLDYLFIFGFENVQPMYLKGAAIASGIADICCALTYIIYSALNKDYITYSIHKVTGYTKKYIQQLLQISTPLILQNSLSIIAWFIFFVMIEKMGKQGFEVSIIIRSIYSVFMMSGIALASATNSMVSNLIGAQKHHEVIPLIYKIVLVSFSFSILISPILILSPDFLVNMFTRDSSLSPLSHAPLVSIFGAVVLFSVSTIFFQAVSGTGNTRITLLIEGICILIYLLYTVYVTVVTPQSLMVVWLAEVLYMISFGSLSAWYIHSLKWKQIRI